MDQLKKNSPAKTEQTLRENILDKTPNILKNLKLTSAPDKIENNENPDNTANKKLSRQREIEKTRSSIHNINNDQQIDQTGQFFSLDQQINNSISSNQSKISAKKTLWKNISSLVFGKDASLKVLEKKQAYLDELKQASLVAQNILNQPTNSQTDNKFTNFNQKLDKLVQDIQYEYGRKDPDSEYPLEEITISKNVPEKISVILRFVQKKSDKKYAKIEQLLG